MDSDNPRTSWGKLAFLVILMGGFSLYILLGLHSSAASYLAVQKELSKPQYSGSLMTISFPDSDKKMNVPSWELFRSGGIWSLVSDTQTLPTSYTPQNLIDLTLPHGDASEPMKIQSTINDSLATLFADAEAAGYPLMISSAYRSIADQQQLYEEFSQTQGQAAADRYVADPGSSEHHTGLAIDFSDTSSACSIDSADCNLSTSTANWLANNAHTYGFILRYPLGKQPITGIAFEPWHYRYVGVTLASLIYESDLTLDEALVQIRPAYTRE